jgi:hypothetical protein
MKELINTMISEHKGLRAVEKLAGNVVKEAIHQGALLVLYQLEIEAQRELKCSMVDCPFAKEDKENKRLEAIKEKIKKG